MIKEPEKILIVRLSAIGDVVHVLPALRSLRSNFPDSKITWLVEDKASDILKDHPDIDEVITFPRRKWQRNILKISKITNTLSEIFSFYEKLRKDRYDIVIDFQGNLKSGVMTIMTGSENRIGFEKGYCKEFNYLFTTHRIRPLHKRMHKIDKNLTLLRGLNIETAFHRPELPVSKEDEKYISKFFRTNVNDSLPIIVVQPCTSKFGSYKQWPVSNYALLADKILESCEANVIFSWGPGEIKVVKKIVRNMKHKALVACKTKSIKQLIELIRRANLFIGGDTGPLHIASILDIPTVGIYGPKDPVIYGPYHSKAVVVRKELWCSPCKRRTCPDPECMTSILPDDVFHAVNKLMDKYVSRKDITSSHKDIAIKESPL